MLQFHTKVQAPSQGLTNACWARVEGAIRGFPTMVSEISTFCIKKPAARAGFLT